MAWRFYTKGGVIVTSDTTDHGALTGLSDDDHPQYLLADGARALTANWDAGDFKITAQQLESDVATGTAPLVVASTTLVTNLNADKVDGKDETAFLLADGSRVLTGDWDIGDGRKVLADQIQARDADGLKLTDDAGNGILVKDGGSVGIGTTSPGASLHVVSGAANQVARFESTDPEAMIALKDSDSTSNYNGLTVKGDRVGLVVTSTERLSVVAYNVGIGTTSPGGGTTAGEHVLSLKDVTNVPAGGVSGQVSLYSSGGELYAFDSAGNATLLSPHKFELFDPDPSYELPFSYYSENRFIGKKINVDMYGAIKALEELTGKQFIYVEDLAPEEVLDWDENEERLQAKRKKEIEEWEKHKAKYDEALAEHEALPEEEREKATPPEPPGEKPKPYKKRTPPNWMAPRLKKPLRKAKKSGSRGRKKS